MNINQIIIKSFSSLLTKSENELLNNWLTENKENRETYLKLKQLHTLGKMRIPTSTKNEKKIIISVKKNIFRNISKRNLHKNTIIKYAAIFVGVIIISGGSYYTVKQYKENVYLTEQQPEIVNSATTRLETTIVKNGKIILLTELTSKMIVGNLAINNNSKGRLLSINSIEEKDQKKEQEFYSIIVPKGRRHVVILPDSSEVHLNSDSELRIPDYFLDTIRNIELKGEGYFKVKHNANAPFIVTFSNNRQVKVLGTEFNINAYNSANNQITLTQGSVIVNSGNNSTTLIPSQQAIINDDNGIKTHKVNASDFTAWIDGRFSYTNTMFSEIVDDLCRRFNYKFIILDQELNNVRLTIKLDENTTITDMIKALNRAGETILKVKLDIESSSILISK